MKPSKPLFNKNKISYEREEKNGYWTFISTTHPETGEIIINPTSRAILHLCNGKYDLQEIIENISKQYPREDKQHIKQDVHHTIAQLSRVGIIDWTGENPFLTLMEESVSTDVSMMIGQEYHITSIESFIHTSQMTPKKQLIHYFSPLIHLQEYNELNLRRKLFTYSEDFFLLLKNTSIMGLLSLEGNTYPHGTTRATIKLFITPETYASHLLHYAQDHYPHLAVQEVTKITILEEAANPLQQPLKHLLKEENYTLEGTLHNELGFGNDVHLWARQYNQQFIQTIQQKQQTHHGT